MKFYPLKIQKVVRETGDSTSIFFEIPENLKDIFSYKPGQYLTMKFEIEEKEHRRAYSICTSPFETQMGVTSKKVHQGLVSGYIHDYLQEGQVVEVLPPAGKFGQNSLADKIQDLYFFASGSGITPIFSMIKSVLEDFPKSTCYLLYGNRDQESIIYKDQLELIASRYESQFYLRHTLTKPIEDKGISSLFKKNKLRWEGWKGRIDENSVGRFLEEYPPKSKDCHYYICGPGDMIDTVKSSLIAREISSDVIHTEHFVNESQKPDNVSLVQDSTNALVKVTLNGQIIEIEVPPDKTILEVLLQLKYDPPYSCTSGACSTCVAKVLSGRAEMEVCYALDEDEIAEGYILTCQSHPVTSEMEIIYET